jgi:hypothetical protein
VCVLATNVKQGWLVRLLPSQPKTHERQQSEPSPEKPCKKAKFSRTKILPFCQRTKLLFLLPYPIGKFCRHPKFAHIKNKKAEEEKGKMLRNKKQMSWVSSFLYS